MLPEILTPIPGPQSLALAARLGQVECRNTTFVSPDWPIFWHRAEGTNIWDADGNRFLDLTSAFGVATLGHGFAKTALLTQADRLLHAMGDVHPASLKVELCEKLSQLTYEKWTGEKGKTLLGNSGFEAVEAALKTAVLATGRSGILAFENAYHGLGYGSLLAAGIPWFRAPFDRQLAPVTTRLPFPKSDLDPFRQALSRIDGREIAAVLVEPMQGRGGIIIPPPEFLREIRTWCDQNGALLIADEIYTGLNRTGKLFGCDHSAVVPDLICLGKALSGGFPISACVGKSSVMDAWPETHGEALHTSTFLGNPLGCAMAIASLEEHAKPETALLSEQTGAHLHQALASLKIHHPIIHEARGLGMMRALELRHPDGQPAGDIAVPLVTALLKKGLILLPDAPEAHVLAFTPPITLSPEEINFLTSTLSDHLKSS